MSTDEQNAAAGSKLHLWRIALSPRTRAERIWVIFAVTSVGTTTSAMVEAVKKQAIVQVVVLNNFPVHSCYESRNDYKIGSTTILTRLPHLI